MKSDRKPNTPDSGARALAAAIAVQKLPAFGASLAAIKQLTSKPDSTGQDLAEAILRDPALTTSVLRAANLAIGLSAYRGDRIRTVSRAVVVLGMNALGALCATSLAVEHVRGDISQLERMRESVGRAIHAATQARDLGQRRGLSRDEAEKLFVEAVLSNVGEVAFWCFGEASAERMDALLRAGTPREQAEKQVLGMRFTDFSAEILRGWNIEEVLSKSPAVELANAFCLSASKGWDSAECLDASGKAALYLGVKTSEARKILAKNAGDAAVIAGALGLRESIRYIPHAEPDSAPHETMATYPQDPALQLKVLSEMVHLADEGGTLQELFSVCVEGLHRAVGLDRVSMLLFDPRRTELSARISLGTPDGYRERFRMPSGPEISEALSPGSIRRYGQGAQRPLWLPGELTHEECLLGAVSVGKNVLGAIYADRGTSERPLDESTVAGFSVFLRQLDLVGRSLAKART